MAGTRLAPCRARGSSSTIPVIVITASEPYWGYPPGHVLRKPIDRDKLISAVRKVIEDRPDLPS